ncbi:DUF7284 family protein [Salinigranum salinum]|uniref:DUF7284 family protein n=1 Tax=Salinigranum salinum TaxID=1364937 RepID=UPI001260D42F|nr:hypothetical protein [Salinigranum salinum]
MISDRRGVSTVVDTALFLLLVSAAVLGVATASADGIGGSGDDGAGDPALTDRDEATVETLATSTATVRYDLGVDRRTNATVTRVRHGSLAGLLAEAAVATIAVDDRRLSPFAEGFVVGVSEAVRPTLDGRTQVVATWTPFPGSNLRGRVVVGPSPPPGAAIHAATLSVDSGLPPAREAALAATDAGHGGVADAVARHTVRGLFPVRRTRVALDGGTGDDDTGDGDTVDATVTRTRFERTASAYGSDAALETGVVPATADLSAAVANRSETTLRQRFETPRTAAESVRTGRVTIVVRTWS